jgi:FkbM family methyltransferase
MGNRLLKLFLLVKDVRYRNILIKKHIAAGIEHSKLLRLLQSQNIKTIIDIGANRGQFAIIARYNFPNAKIFSFEPLQEAARIFRDIFKNDKNTELYELAVGPKEIKSIIHISKADDSSSLLPISELQKRIYPGTVEIEQRVIQQKPLGAILLPEDIKKTAFMKIDVQGYELQVLEGCASLLHIFSFLYIECSFLELYTGQSLVHEIISFLANRQFTLSGIYNLDYDKKGQPIQGDFLFSKQS